MSTINNSGSTPRLLPLNPDEGPHRTVRAMVGLLALFTVCAVAWAAIAQLDVAVQARGIVIAPSRMQEVQSLEGGIVEQMLVHAGQAVRQGEPVARLDTAQYAAGVGESRPQYIAALAGRARTEALLAGVEPRFDPTWAADAPELIAQETRHWRDALHEYQSALSASGEVIRQRGGELSEAEARIASARKELSVAQESFQIEQGLFEKGAGARADFLAAQARLLGQRSQLDALQQSLPRLQAALAAARAEGAQTASRFRAQWGQQHSEFDTQAGRFAQTLKAQDDKLSRRELLAPVNGIVNRVLVPTRGGVVMPGKAILEIVPDEALLQMSARVQPNEIGFLHPGQKAKVTVLAYDSATFGQIEATLERVGADAVVDEKGNAYFEVQLSAERGQLKLHGKPLALSPGMPVELSILTGERSVMQYLLKPVLRGVQGALQER